MSGSRSDDSIEPITSATCANPLLAVSPSRGAERRLLAGRRPGANLRASHGVRPLRDRWRRCPAELKGIAAAGDADRGAMAKRMKRDRNSTTKSRIVPWLASPSQRNENAPPLRGLLLARLDSLDSGCALLLGEVVCSRPSQLVMNRRLAMGAPSHENRLQGNFTVYRARKPPRVYTRRIALGKPLPLSSRFRMDRSTPLQPGAHGGPLTIAKKKKNSGKPELLKGAIAAERLTT
jgi:hypothetical protein